MDKEVVYPVKRSQAAVAERVLTASISQDDGWMWTNKGTQSIRIQAELARGGASCRPGSHPKRLHEKVNQHPHLGGEVLAAWVDGVHAELK